MGLIEIKSPQFSAAARALGNLGGEIEKQIDAASKQIEPEWKRLVAGNAKTTAERRLIGAPARLSTSGEGVRLVSEGGRLSRGLSSAEHGGAVEFGVDRNKVTSYKRRSKKGGSHTVRRHTARQLKQFNKAGHVFTPAVKAFIPKLAKAWTEAVSKAAEDALNGKD